MTTTLGKRKRQAPLTTGNLQRSSSEESGSSEIHAQEIFRRHFEARFKPLPTVEKSVKVVEETPRKSSEEDSEWDGISDEEERGVQVVEHVDAQLQMTAMSKAELKAFMSSKPPTAVVKIPPIRDKSGAAIDDEDPSEAANLKKDLALQRLLAESHLLESSSNPTLSGNNRHKATDMRLQTLGSKISILKQEKMPMSHRKGITAKQSEREEKRRREAKENGIVLEKAKMKKSFEGKRDRGVGAPGIGRFAGGTLNLSKKDISNIEGPKRTASGRGNRGGRGRGKRGR